MATSNGIMDKIALGLQLANSFVYNVSADQAEVHQQFIPDLHNLSTDQNGFTCMFWSSKVIDYKKSNVQAYCLIMTVVMVCPLTYIYVGTIISEWLPWISLVALRMEALIEIRCTSGKVIPVTVYWKVPWRSHIVYVHQKPKQTKIYILVMFNLHTF